MYFVSSLNPQQATSEHTCDVPVMAQDQKDTALNAWLLRPLYAMAHTVVGYITSNWKATDMTDERRPNAASEVMGDDTTYDMIDDKEEIVEQRQKYLASSNWVTSIERTFRNHVAPLLPIAQTDVFVERVKRTYNYYCRTSTAACCPRSVPRGCFCGSAPAVYRIFRLQFSFKNCRMADPKRFAMADDNDTWVPLEKQGIEDDFFGADEDYDHVHEDEDYDLVQEKEAKEGFPANIRRYEKDAYHEQIFPSCRRTSIRNRVYRWYRVIA
ncbi:hypothetical protein BCR43DRAFT_515746 [Syncephalastrum racemosum]|uniref:Uncharacterized protein n=1 Tax=Syncephalastrum racemosum TaxID=13706 RepID=A0A1X2HAE4_SYNRA|nr:hypothetical protein BCR43DRAFT_515746 [Syncephalastrum racemosum]